jgi:hypothetical protein
MAVFPTQYRPTDDVREIRFTPAAGTITTIVALPSSVTAGHIKLFTLSQPAKVMQIVAITGAGATTNTTLRAATSGPGVVTALTSDLPTVRGTATGTLTVSAYNSLDLTADTVGDTDVPPTLPAGTTVGVNLITGASSTTELHGFLVRLRYIQPAI